MHLSQRSSRQLGGRAVLLSIKPKYADLILSGSKRVEFRRSWAAQDVSVIVLYSSSPIQKIVGMVEVEQVVVTSPTSLWKTCSERGGGLTKKELRSYFSGKSKGVAVLLGQIFKFDTHLKPSDLIEQFTPPQSFRYLSENEYKIILKNSARQQEEQ